MKLKVRTLVNLPAGKHFDGHGLYLEVMPSGSRFWRMKFRHNGKESRLSFGPYPEVGLAEARDLGAAARSRLRAGIDPAAERKAERRQQQADGLTFAILRDEWLALQESALSLATVTKARWLFSLASDLDPLPVSAITAQMVLAVLKKIEAKGHHETVRRVKQRISQVFRFSVATGRAEIDPTASLRGALAPVKTTNRAAIIDPKGVGDLLRALDTYGGAPTTNAALKLAPMVFARPGNLRAMEWSEIDFIAAEWRIPAGKMKMRDAHVVPLSTQALAILRDLQSITGHGRYCFPSLHAADRPMSENTINVALRRLGFDKETMTGHGFRALASSLLHELGWSPDVIDRQLAHAERNKVRAAYHRAQYLAERKKMMQAWADYLDQLRAATDIARSKRQARRPK
ncbi:tyrosine-type recombinase/integrase [Lysobacter arenosi]|uniref:Tyrosine-type recombinase/integrase n=1 Tax=Lysobacter arenosi TaxID=2795387 RepID=A0ABX7RDQ6_9GAMM|nr:integrase arm-type DNA-binding domain-containing protein [Lysobacter arenosi]QSX75613.1 tyrosine-type recombinase/integrase [Lysobacter arenosi]